MRPVFCLIIALMAALSASSALAQSPQKWVTSWTGSVQGPYPIGNASAQPDLRFVLWCSNADITLSPIPSKWRDSTALRPGVPEWHSGSSVPVARLLAATHLASFSIACAAT